MFLFDKRYVFFFLHSVVLAFVFALGVSATANTEETCDKYLSELRKWRDSLDGRETAIFSTICVLDGRKEFADFSAKAEETRTIMLSENAFCMRYSDDGGSRLFCQFGKRCLIGPDVPKCDPNHLQFTEVNSERTHLEELCLYDQSVLWGFFVGQSGVPTGLSFSSLLTPDCVETDDASTIIFESELSTGTASLKFSKDSLKLISAKFFSPVDKFEICECLFEYKDTILSEAPMEAFVRVYNSVTNNTIMSKSRIMSVANEKSSINRYGDFFINRPDDCGVYVRSMPGISFVWNAGEIVRKVDKRKLDELDHDFERSSFRLVFLLFSVCVIVSLLLSFFKGKKLRRKLTVGK